MFRRTLASASIGSATLFVLGGGAFMAYLFVLQESRSSEKWSLWFAGFLVLCAITLAVINLGRFETDDKEIRKYNGLGKLLGSIRWDEVRAFTRNEVPLPGGMPGVFLHGASLLMHIPDRTEGETVLRGEILRQLQGRAFRNGLGDIEIPPSDRPKPGSFFLDGRRFAATGKVVLSDDGIEIQARPRFVKRWEEVEGFEFYRWDEVEHDRKGISHFIIRSGNEYAAFSDRIAFFDNICREIMARVPAQARIVLPGVILRSMDESSG